MKQLFEWIKATPDNLPKESVFINIHTSLGVIQSIGDYKHDEEGFMTWRGEFYPIDQYTVEYLSPASPPESQLSEGGEEKSDSYWKLEAAKLAIAVGGLREENAKLTECLGEYFSIPRFTSKDWEEWENKAKSLIK